ncbi:MAG: peptidoglycan D,D-transpeptidase FtsI family protein [Solirubrobacteraceae bacterium]|nr:MAG: stage V sporulation protein D [Solirubrobacterales bacterium]
MTAIERRIGLLFVLFIALLAVGGIRAAYFGAVRGPTLRRVAASQQVSVVSVPAPRGTITDRNGVQLAVSEPADSLVADPYLIKDPVNTGRLIAPLVGKPADQLVNELARAHTGFVYIARQLPDDRARRVQGLGIAGLSLIPEMRRTYPQDWLASQLLGTVGTDGSGLSGLEWSQDGSLRGHAGVRRVVKDALGQAISVQDLHPTRPGHSLQLTIDANIESKTEQVLQQIGATYRPKRASAIVMNPHSGEILALANWPLVNANDIGGAPPAARQNGAAVDSYEPGSTFKSFTVAGALEDRVVTPQTSFDLAPSIQVADRVIHDAENRPAVTLSTARILAQSSNVGAITIGLREGASPFSSWVRRFGFGSSTGSDVPGEAAGIVPKLAQYSGSSMGNLPIGQGLAVTPLQMITAYAAIADGGLLRAAHVVAAVNGHRVAARPGRRVISPATAASLRSMLQGVLAPGGTASQVSVPGYQLAGKTGTANVAINGGYSQSLYVSSFVGMAPAIDPRLLALVVVDEPQGSIYGGTVAAPAFGQIAAFALPYLRIAPS